jgi:hypothetical protein
MLKDFPARHTYSITVLSNLKYIQCCDPTVYGTVDGNTVRYRNYGTPPYSIRFSQIWDRITVDYGTVYGTVHNLSNLKYIASHGSLSNWGVGKSLGAWPCALNSNLLMTQFFSHKH